MSSRAPTQSCDERIGTVRVVRLCWRDFHSALFFGPFIALRRSPVADAMGKRGLLASGARHLSGDVAFFNAGVARQP